MPRNTYGDEDDFDSYADEDLDINESPDEFDEDEDEDETDLTECPACGAEIYGLSEQCPVCGEYITHSTDWRQGRPWWFVALGTLGILATIAVLCLTWW
jgi:predicted RNA-binding Zn-ribbon protein involved in translation (DUF1610 family)